MGLKLNNKSETKVVHKDARLFICNPIEIETIYIAIRIYAIKLKGEYHC